MDDKELHEGAKFDPMTGKPLEEINNTINETAGKIEEIAGDVNETAEKAEETVNNETVNAATENVYDKNDDSSAETVNSYNAFMRDNDNKEEFNLNLATAKVKSKGKGIVAGIVAGVLVIAGGVTAFAFRDNIVNKFKLMTMSSSEYYRYVIQKESDNKISDGIDGYKYIYDLVTSNKMEAEVNFKAEAGDDVLDSLKTLGVDTYGIESFGACLTTGIEDDTTSAALSVDINDTRLVTGEAFLDLKNIEGYARVPELSESYLDLSNALNKGIEDSKYDIGDLQDVLDLIKNDDIYPSPKVLEKEIERYRDVYLDYVVDKELVEKSTKSLSANNISEKDTVLKVSLDGDEVIELFIEYLEEIKKDDDLKNYVNQVIEPLRNPSIGGNQEISDFEIDDEIDKFIDKMKDEKEKAKSYKDIIEIETYVNGKGKIRGLKVVATENDKKSFVYEDITTIKGNKMGYKLSLKVDKDEIVNVKGSGNADFSKTNAKYTATFKNDEKKYTVKIDVDDLNTTQYLKGIIKGKITLRSDDIYKDGKIVIDVDNTRKESNMEVEVYKNDKQYAKLTLGTKFTDEPKSLKPDSSATLIDVTDENAFMNYLGGIDAEKFVNDFTSKANISLDYDQVLELINSISSYSREITNIPSIIGGNEYNYSDYDYGNSEPSTSDYDYDSDYNYDFGDDSEYDEDYWNDYYETYEYPTYDENYWETYEAPSYDEGYWETYDWDSLLDGSSTNSDI